MATNCNSKNSPKSDNTTGQEEFETDGTHPVSEDSFSIFGDNDNTSSDNLLYQIKLMIEKLEKNLSSQMTINFDKLTRKISDNRSKSQGQNEENRNRNRSQNVDDTASQAGTGACLEVATQFERVISMFRSAGKACILQLDPSKERCEHGRLKYRLRIGGDSSKQYLSVKSPEWAEVVELITTGGHLIAGFELGIWIGVIKEGTSSGYYPTDIIEVLLKAALDSEHPENFVGNIEFAFPLQSISVAYPKIFVQEAANIVRDGRDNPNSDGTFTEWFELQTKCNKQAKFRVGIGLKNEANGIVTKCTGFSIRKSIK